MVCVCAPVRVLSRPPPQLRRRPKENNFKAVLESIRDVMNVAAAGKAVPPWLHNVFLGYGDPAAAHYKSLPPPYSQHRALDMGDTFINGAHALASFPGQVRGAVGGCVFHYSSDCRFTLSLSVS